MMPPSPQQDLETWIASRKGTPRAHLTRGVMEELQNEAPSIIQASSPSRPPSWLFATGCLIAGIGKLTLVFHLAF